MSTVQEIEAAFPRLSRPEPEELRAWFDEFLENQLELTDEVKAKLEQSRGEIAAGNYELANLDNSSGGSPATKGAWLSLACRTRR